MWHIWLNIRYNAYHWDWISRRPNIMPISYQVKLKKTDYGCTGYWFGRISGYIVIKNFSSDIFLVWYPAGYSVIRPDTGYKKGRISGTTLKTIHWPEESLSAEERLLPGPELEEAVLVVHHRHDYSRRVGHDLHKIVHIKGFKRSRRKRHLFKTLRKCWIMKAGYLSV